MTSIVNRPDIPQILPAEHARPSLRRTLAAGLRHAPRAIANWVSRVVEPWSFGVVFAGFLMLLVPVGEEIAEAVGYEISPTGHLVFAGLAFLGVAIYLLHKGTQNS